MGRKEANTGRQFETNVRLRLQLTVHVMLMSVALHQKLSPCESHVRKNTNGRSEGDIGYSHSLKIRINIFIKKNYVYASKRRQYTVSSLWNRYNAMPARRLGSDMRSVRFLAGDVVMLSENKAVQRERVDRRFGCGWRAWGSFAGF